MQLHLLLFADDIVLISKSVEGLEALLQLVGTFCDNNGLVVSTSKTKCLYLVNKRNASVKHK